MATITGKWRWNETIEGTEDIQDLHINIRFDSIGERFHGIRVDKGVDGVYRLRYLPYEGSAPIVFQSTRNTMDSTMQLSLEEYRIIDFRRDVLSIDQDAYEFIVANAEPFYDIADKLSRVYKNVGPVYYAGKSAGREEGKTQGYTEGYRNGKHEGYIEGKAEGYQDGLVSSEAYEKGKQAEYDAFWDAYQLNGNRGVYESAFAGQGWNDKTFNPKYPIVVTGSSWNMFYSCNVKDGYEHLKNVDFSKCTLLTSTFAQCHMKHLGTIDCRNVKSVYQVFFHARSLQTIDKIIVDVDNTFSSPFDNTLSLENVTFEGEIGNNLVMAGTYGGTKWGDKLTRASIENIINHLSDNVSGKSLTLSKTAADTAFPCWWDNPETGESENVGCGGNGEWLELIAPKVENDKWIINLV